MAESGTQTIKVLIKPAFASNRIVQRLSISLTLESPAVPAGSTLASFATTIKSIDLRPEVKSLVATDARDSLALHSEGSGTQWTAERPTSGDVVLLYEVYPSPANMGRSPYILTCDQGGLIGSGFSFIPDLYSSNFCRLVVEWDLNEAPSETRAVWTFGEGPAPVEMTGPATVLLDSVYMVGPIQSNPSASILNPISDYYGYYCFGSLPQNIEVIKDIHHSFFERVSAFFEDTPSASNPYRSFIRQAPDSPFNGTSFTRSHIFTYDTQIHLASDYDLTRHLAYEMIDLHLGASVTDPTSNWLFQGIKNVLSIYLPFRTGFRTPDYFQATMAMWCMKYYSNPLINLPHSEALAVAPTNEYAHELLGARAWAFVILTDFRSRKVAEEKAPHLMPRPLEDVAIKVLARRKRDGGAHGIEQFLELLDPLMGNETRELYAHMLSGATIVLPEKFFGPKTHLMQKTQLEKLDFGLDRKSFRNRVVSGLVDGSRAQEAGLREGDRITRTSPVWRCVDYFREEMEVVVEREEEEVVVRYWPRSREKVEGLEFVKIKNH